MDLCFKRYASPFSLLDHLIMYRSLSAFVTQMWNEYNDELLWDLYLRSTMEESFEDFKYRIRNRGDMTKEEIETTINTSKNMLNSFKPLQKGGADH